jgi:hypothetical protein
MTRHARSRRHDVNWVENVVDERPICSNWLRKLSHKSWQKYHFVSRCSNFRCKQQKKRPDLLSKTELHYKLQFLFLMSYFCQQVCLNVFCPSTSSRQILFSHSQYLSTPINLWSMTEKCLNFVLKLNYFANFERLHFYHILVLHLISRIWRTPKQCIDALDHFLTMSYK